VWQSSARVARLITGLRVQTKAAGARERSDEFMAAYASVLGSPRVIHKSVEKGSTRTSVHYRQVHQGLSVLDRSLVITMSNEGIIKTVTNDLEPIRSVQRAVLDEETAKETALNALNQQSELPLSMSAYTVIHRGLVVLGGAAREVIEVSVSRHPLREYLSVRIDGVTGKVLRIQNQMIH
jgi:Zn-dependent metalloprotease